MEKIAYEIQDILQEKLSCYRQLNRVLEEEKGHISSIDLDALWQNTRIKRELAGRIKDLRKKILGCLQDSVPGMGMDSATFSLAYMVNALPLSHKAKAGLRKVKQEIDHAKDQMVRTAKLNQVQVRKYLSVADDIMSVIGDNSSRAQYSGSGVVSGQMRKNCLFRAEV